MTTTPRSPSRGLRRALARLGALLRDRFGGGLEQATPDPADLDARTDWRGDAAPTARPAWPVVLQPRAAPAPRRDAAAPAAEQTPARSGR